MRNQTNYVIFPIRSGALILKGPGIVERTGVPVFFYLITNQILRGDTHETDY